MSARTTPPRTAVRRLALGRLISTTGDFAAAVSLTFVIWEQTRSAAWISATGILTWGVMGFLAPVAGAIADRVDRRRVMIVAEVAAAGCWAVMTFATGSPVALLALGFFASLLLSPYLPASGAAIPNVAGAAHLAWANSLMAVGRYAAVTIGPLVVATLGSAVEARWIFLVNALSFIVSAALTASVHADFADRDPERASEHGTGVAVGFRFIRRDPVLLTLVASYFVFILGMGTTIVADPVLSDAFGWGQRGYSLILACWGAGTIAGAWFGRHVTEDREASWIIGFSALVALSGFGVALSPWFVLVLFWSLVFGVTDGPTQVIEQNLLQRRTPDQIRSRVMGAYESVMHAGIVIAMAAGGWIVSLVGPKGAYVVGGVLGLVGTGLLLPLLRHLPSRRASEATVG